MPNSKNGRTTRERVLSRLIIDPSGCLLWQGSLDRYGYGRFGDKILVHRAVFEMFVGPIPDGMELDHLCRVRQCASPAHLEPVTHAENMRRGENHNSLKTHCVNGHEYTPENTYRRPSGEKRHCRACSRDSTVRYQARKRVAS